MCISGVCIFFLTIPLSKKKSFPGSLNGKESACNAEDLGSIPRSGDPLEKGMAIHSSIFTCRILQTEEPGGLQFMGSQRVIQD